ncbi:MAG TPA: nucleoside triphosphate pyrophosphohydrolase [Pseudogracilibacillus sp.]|nr:nucleoside triphosphate pyrophosphohydrolase [Pseudogracilibacillus sp.]
MKEIEVIGLGAGTIDQLPLGIYRTLKETEKTIYVRTEDHPVVDSLRAEGINLQSFDYLYEEATQFQDVYENIVKTLLEKLTAGEKIIYAVPGHPMLAEQTVQLLLAEADLQVNLAGGQSYLDDLFSSLKIDPIDGFQFVDATAFNRDDVNFRQHLIFCQVYDSLIASDLKLTLLEDLPYDYEIIVAEAVGTKEEVITRLALENLDREVSVSNLTSVYVPPVEDKRILDHQFASLRSVIASLRGPDGCPWDRKQTHESLRPYAIEEVYELIDAIDRQDDEAIISELGDVLLQVMLHSQIGEDNGYFTVDDVIASIVRKMIHRHPHVFDKEGPQKSWDELKREERANDVEERLLDSVIMNGPSLQVAEKLQAKAAKVGFDWDEVEPIWEKLREEIDEFHEAVAENDFDHQEEEFGDVLFVLANIARFYHIRPELALRRANQKFKRRFTGMEEIVEEKGTTWKKLSLAEWDEIWDQVKGKE